MDQASLLRGLHHLIQAFPTLPHTRDAPKHPGNRSSSSSSRPTSFQSVRRLLTQPSLTDSEVEELRVYLAHLLLLPNQARLQSEGVLNITEPPLPAFPLTVHLIRLFRPLIASLVQPLSARPPPSLTAFQRTAVALSQVATLCPHTSHAVASYLRSSPFSLFDSLQQPHSSQASDTSTATPPSSSSPPDPDAVPPLHLVYAAYRYLSLDYPLFHSFFRSCASSPTLQTLLTCGDDPLTRFYAVRCLSAFLRLTDAQRDAFHLRFLASSPSPSPSPSDPADLEQRHAEALQAELGAVWVNAIPLQPVSSLPPSPTLPPPPPASKGGFVVLPSTLSTLSSLSLLLTQPRPILLTGAAGCGKTCLIHHLHSLHHSTLDPTRPHPSHPPQLPLLTLHITSAIDSKTLLGSYTSTSTPGEFVWSAGALTRAVSEGRWVVVEDVDRAEWEVVSGLRGLMERGEVEVRGEVITAKEGFRLFATRSEEGGGRVARGWSMLSAFFSHVHCPQLTEVELTTVIHSSHPTIPHHYVPIVLATYRLFTSPSSHSFPLVQQALGTRRLRTRDLFRWCRRLGWLFAKGEGWNAAGMNEEMMDSILRSIIEVFLASAPSSLHAASLRASIVREVVALWSIPPERIEHHLQHYKPHFHVTHSTFSIASYDLPIQRRSLSSPAPLFTPTRHALLVLSSIASALTQNEPLVLVGEAGVGKTSVLQFLAHSLGVRLTVLNLNHQSDASDVVGGYRPYEMGVVVMALVNELVGSDDLFGKVISRKANTAWLIALERAVQRKEWKKTVRMLHAMAERAAEKLQLKGRPRSAPPPAADERKVDEGVRVRWQRFYHSVNRLALQVQQMQGKASLPLFHFSEGALIAALRAGNWILLDEINLASADTLERLTGLLDSSEGSVSLTERGDIDVVPRHPNFRLFAAMNPPDYGKKDLPPSIRSRFTELHVPDVEDSDDLRLITHAYLQRAMRVAGRASIGVDEVVRTYEELRRTASSGLIDGSGQPPLYSLRTYCRALTYASQHSSQYTLPRALYEGFMMAFASPLSLPSKQKLQATLMKLCKLKPHHLVTPSSTLPAGHVDVQGFHIALGPYPAPPSSSPFIITPTISRRLCEIARALLSPHPILLQGPTSAGKTSLVHHLASLTHHHLVRINNHQHTDVSEYLGAYCGDERGQLKFREGVLVEAVRKGWWIVLDELNLAPSEVLEALNRLLDDNRELHISDTNELLKAHADFRLFATQNPAGLYGGRKVLSKAFVNRFVVFHVEDLPVEELSEVISRRCEVAKSHAERMIDVMQRLQQQRDSHSLFLGKSSLITPRDLFRWGERMKEAKDSTVQTLAERGFMLLGERLRSDEGRRVVKEVIEEACGKGKAKGSAAIDLDRMYGPQAVDAMVRRLTGGKGWEEVTREQADRAKEMGLGRMAWTRSLRRMFILAAECVLHSEPVLLVGDTGVGKTSVCQLLSLLVTRPLEVLNVHQHTETSDFLGGLRPVRHREATAKQLGMQLQAFASSLTVDDALPASLAALVTEDDRRALQNDDVEVAMKAVERVASALRSVQDEQRHVHEESKKRPAAAASVDSSKRKRQKPSSAKAATTTDSLNALTVEPSAAGSSALLSSLLAATSELQALHAQSLALFEWSNGPLLRAMLAGHLLLIDEIALANDATLERLNPVLEPGRSLLLTEKPDTSDAVIVAADAFHVMATMNPGGDYGKKELSPALRNRMTEIWVPGVEARDDLRDVVVERMRAAGAGEVERLEWSEKVVEFTSWYNAGQVKRRQLSLRDVLAWVAFIVHLTQGERPVLTMEAAYLQGACLVLLDGLGIGSSDNDQQVQHLKARCIDHLLQQVHTDRQADYVRTLFPRHRLSTSGAGDAELVPVVSTESYFGVAPFLISRGPLPLAPPRYSFSSPTPHSNLQRMLRALHLPRAILLEGSPGVGKSSLITALASASSHPLVRINLSEQTDMMDLLGVDLPVTGAKAGTFQWCDGVFLQALKRGDWVLLDELNLASQSVLEGLNAVLDHRAEIFIPELGQAFHPPPSFRIFACQNPMGQGGGRHGLPSSFLNRFTKVQLEVLQEDDLLSIGRLMWRTIPDVSLQWMIRFNERLYEEVVRKGSFGKKGGPWEFNLRDIGRWCELMEKGGGGSPGRWVDLVYLQRMRTQEDRDEVIRLYLNVFPDPADALHLQRCPPLSVTPSHLRIGDATLARITNAPVPPTSALPTLHSHSAPLAHLIACVNLAYPVLLVGASCTAKSNLVHSLAAMSGHQLMVVQVNESMDSSDLLGCFEQMDLSRERKALMRAVSECVDHVSAVLLAGAAAAQSAEHGGVVVVDESARRSDAARKRSREADPAHERKKRKATAGTSATPSTSNGQHITLSAAAELSLAEVGSLHSLLRQCVLDPHSFDASSSTSTFTPEAQTALSRLLEQLTSVVTARSLSLPPRLSPSSLSSHLSHLLTLSSSPSSVIGTFQWIDGTLLTALEHGHWLLLENLNYTSPSTLDRLNGLMERGGVLMVNECGLQDGRVRIVTPHPNFRLFGTINEEYGQVSRAMRNRCVEIALLDPVGHAPAASKVETQVMVGQQEEAVDIPSAVVDAVECDLMEMCHGLGVLGAVVPAFMVAVHRHVTQPSHASSASSSSSVAITVRHLRQWGALLSQQLCSGASPSLFDSAVFTFRHAYSTLDFHTNVKLQSFVLTSFNELVVRAPLRSALLTPTMGSSLPRFPSLLSSAVEGSVRRAGALIDYLLRASACKEFDSASPHALDQLMQRIRTHPQLMSCLPTTLLRAMTQPKGDFASTAFQMATSPTQPRRWTATSTPAMVLDVSISGLTRSAEELTPMERAEVLEPGALVPSFINSSHPQHPLPTPVHLLRLALLHFIASTPSLDIALRFRFLSHLYTLASTSAAASRELVTAIEVLQRRRGHPLLSNAAGPIVPLLMSHLHRHLREAEAEAEFRRDGRPAAALSPLQQSFAHHQGILRGRLQADVLAVVYPLFGLFDAALYAAFVASAPASEQGRLSPPLLVELHTACEQRQWLWDCLNESPSLDGGSSAVDIEAILIRWRALGKTTRSLHGTLAQELDGEGAAALSTAFALLLAHFESMETLLGTSTAVGSRELLFKHGGHPLLPHSVQLSDLQHALLSLNQRVQWSASGDNEAFWLMDDAWQSSLLDALCSIRFLTYQSAASQLSTEVEQLLELLSSLPSKMTARLDALRVEAAQRHNRELFAVQLLSNVDSSLEDLGLTDLQPSEADGEVDQVDEVKASADVLMLRTSVDRGGQLSRASLGVVQPLADLLAIGAQLEVTALMAAFVYIASTSGTEQRETSTEGQAILVQREALTMLPSLASALLALLPRLLLFCSTYSTASPAALVPLQSSQWILERLQPALPHTPFTSTATDAHAMWSAESRPLVSALPIVLSELTTSLFSFLHSASFNAAASSSSAVLLTPHLSALLSRLVARASGVSLTDRHTKRAQISVAIDILVQQRRLRNSTAPGHSPARRRSEWTLLGTQLAWTVQCYLPAFTPADAAVIEAFCQGLMWGLVQGVPPVSPDHRPSLISVSDALVRCRDNRFASLLSSYILPAFRLVCVDEPSITDLHLAQLALLVSLTRLQLYLPLSPFDASRSHLLALSDAHFSHSSIVRRLQFRQWHDSLQHGDVVRDPEWSLLVHEKTLTEQRMRRVRKKVTVRRAGARPFTDLYDELHRFASDFLRKTVELQRRVELQRVGAGEEEQSMLRRELQQSEEVTSNCVRHLRLVYDHYPDVIEPIITLLLQANDALARVVHLSLRTVDDQAALLLQTLRALLAFPLPSSVMSPSSTSLTSLQSLVSLLHPAALDAFDIVCQRAVAALKAQKQSQPSESAAVLSREEGALDVAAVGAADFSSSRVLVLLSVLSRAVMLYRQQRTFASASPDSSLYALFDILFSTFVDCWQRERREQRLQEEEAAKLYKFEERQVAPLTEEEQDEQLRRELYPDFRDDWTDIERDGRAVMEDEDEEDEERTSQHRAQVEAERRREETMSPMHLSTEHQLAVYSAFASLFSSSSSTSHRLRVSEQQLIDAYAYGYSAASTLLSALSLCPSPSLSSLPSSLDDEALMGHLFQLANTHQRLHTLTAVDADAWIERERTRLPAPTSEADVDDSVPLTKRQQRKREQREQRRAEVAAMPDVWKAPNVEEIRRLEPALLSLSVRIRAILNEYPQQEMLVQMLKVIHRLSSLPSTSPVMQLLTGTELLLRKAEEWEKHASRGVSLKAEAMRLRALVVRWRKMELYAWPKALRGVEEKHQLSGISAFFHLWSVLHVTHTWDSGSEEERRFFLTLYDSLLSFLRLHCKLGEFETRLDVVRAFAHQMAVAVQTSRSTPSGPSYLEHFHLRLHCLLLNVYYFHLQWLPLVQSFIAQLSAPLEKQLTDQVTLSRWDLGNYEQLRESSEKNHKRLVTVSRRYEEVLAMNVAAVIDKEEGRREQQKTVDLGRVGREVDRVTAQHEQLRVAEQRRQEKLQAMDVAVQALDDESVPPLSSALFTAPPPVQLYLVAEVDSTLLSSVQVPLTTKARSVLSIFTRMQRLLSSSVLHSSYVESRARSGAAVEGFTVSVIERIRSLQSSDANRHRKMKALVDVRKALEGLGLRYTEEDIGKARAALSSDASLAPAGPTAAVMGEGEMNLTAKVAAELMSVPLLFSAPPLASVFVLSSSHRYTVSDSYAVLGVLGEQCDEYAWKVAALLVKVRVKVHSHHADLSAVEVRKGKGMLDFLTVRLAHLRQAIASLGRDMQRVGQWIDIVDALAQSLPPAATAPATSLPTLSGITSHDSLWQHKLALDGLLASLQYYSCLYQRLAGILEPSPLREQLLGGQSVLSALLTTAQTMKGEVDAEVERAYPSIPLSVHDSSRSADLASLMEARWSTMISTHRQQLQAQWTQSDVASLLFVHDSAGGLQRLYEVLTSPPGASMDLRTQSADGSDSLSLTEPVSGSFAEVVRRVQLLVQEAKSLAPLPAADAGVNEGEAESAALPLVQEMDHHHTWLSMRHFHSLDLALTVHVHHLARLARQQPSVESSSLHSSVSSLAALLPLLQQSLLLSQRLLVSSLTFLRSSTKLSYVLLSSFLTLLTHGFCRQPQQADEEDSGKTEEGVEGTGMGEGEGEKDVSEQLEEQQQLEGLREEDQDTAHAEKKAEKEKSKEELDKGMDMEADFDGDMYDQPEEGEKDEEEEDGDKEELEREMGEADERHEAVDEKVWDESEEEEERDRTQEKERKGQDTAGHEDDTEMVAKEDEDEGEEQQPPGKDEEQKRKEEKEAAEKKEDRGKEKEEADVEEVEERGGINSNEEDRVEESGIEPFQLPDDVNLDDDDEGEQPTGEEKEEGEGEVDESQDDDAGEELTEEERQKLEGEAKEEEEGGGKEGEQKLEEDRTAKDEMENKEAPLEDVEERIPPAVNGEAEEKEEEEQQGEDAEEEQPPQQEKPTVDGSVDDQKALGTEREDGGNQGGQGEEAAEKERPPLEQEELRSLVDDEQRPQGREDGAASTNSSEAEQGAESEWRPSDAAPSQQSHPPQSAPRRKKEIKANPYQSLGDSLKKWQERLRILDNDDDDQRADEAQARDALDEEAEEELSGTVQNVPKDETADAQMLGPVEEKEEEQLEFPKEEEKTKEELGDETMDQEDGGRDDSRDANLKKEEEEAESRKDEEGKSRRGGRDRLAPTRLSEVTSNGEEKQAEEMEEEFDLLNRPVERKEEEDNGEEEKPMSSIGPTLLDRPLSTPSSPADELPSALLAELRAELDERLRSSPSPSSAALIWHQLTSLTSPLSHSLCELLRIVLEPTLCSHLRGDYKTGKRLNLKKIIPYIASEFRKDKIWLRRSLPSARQYQVMLAIDDSQSMQKGGAGRTALEAMATITQALHQLEVGEVGVVHFGERLTLLHSFDRPWTEDSGRHAVSQFGFKQGRTRWPTVLEGLVTLLEEARKAGGGQTGGGGGGSASFSQLCFLISDGNIQQDREEVRRWTREAQRRQMLLVLIIVDTDERSITTTQRYVGGAAGAGGKMFVSYLDDFPFPYYLILRQIEQLPQVLSDALRQWFEVLATQSGDD